MMIVSDAAVIHHDGYAKYYCSYLCDNRKHAFLERLARKFSYTRKRRRRRRPNLNLHTYHYLSICTHSHNIRISFFMC